MTTAAVCRHRVRTATFAMGAGLSVIWLALATWYIQTQIGWSSLGIMLPHELGAALSGVATPLLVLWLVIAFVERGPGLRTAANQLRPGLQGPSYPKDQAREKGQTVGPTLRQPARAPSA